MPSKVRALLVALTAIAALSFSPGRAVASFVTFIPPNDPNGQIFSTNSNDGYDAGRGIVFQANANTTINTIGLFQDLTGITLNYTVAEIPSFVGDLTASQTVLRQGSRTVTTSGLEFVDFRFADLTFQQGHDYHIEFKFNGLSNQNFFFNNVNNTWSQGAYTVLDGTQGGTTLNTVVAKIHVGYQPAVPEPTSLVMLGTGLFVTCGCWLRRRSPARRAVA